MATVFLNNSKEQPIISFSIKASVSLRVDFVTSIPLHSTVNFKAALSRFLQDLISTTIL